MSEGIGREDLKNGAVNHEKMSFGGRLKTFSWSGICPLTGVTDNHTLGVPSQDFQITKISASWDKDGAGSGNKVAIDIFDDGATVLSSVMDFITATDTIDTPEDAALDAAKTLVAKGSLLQLNLVGSGTTTAGHHIGVEVEGHYVD